MTTGWSRPLRPAKRMQEGSALAAEVRIASGAEAPALPCRDAGLEALLHPAEANSNFELTLEQQSLAACGTLFGHENQINSGICAAVHCSPTRTGATSQRAQPRAGGPAHGAREGIGVGGDHRAQGDGA